MSGLNRSNAPRWVKRSGRRAARGLGLLTAGRRMLPAVLLAGGQRCGTTSLHKALIAHPVISGPVLHKGVNYFDVNYHRGMRWYRGHFPLLVNADRRAAAAGFAVPPVAMESSGYYLYHPLAMARIARDLPGVKVVVMVRDPVERAYSAYKHEVARGFETESFERALDLEAERLAGEVERLRTEPRYESYAHRHHAYVERGHYVDQLQTVRALLGRDRLYVLESEDFFAAPARAYAEVLEFLGLPQWRPETFERHNARPGSDLDPRLRRRLEQHYEPYDERLAELLGHPPAWRR